MVIAEFLSRFATPRGSAQDQRVRAAARRFAGLIGGSGAPAPAGSIDSRATLLVQSGLHRGASLELTTDECIVGSDDACDLVLQDRGLAPRQCRIVRAADGFSIHDLRTPAQALAAQAVRHADGVIESTYEVGASVLLAVVQRAPAPAARARARRVARERSGMRIFVRALSAALLLTGLAFLAAHRLVERTQPDLAARIVQGGAALASQGFGALRFRRGAGGELQITGVVADARELQRLREWLERAHYGDAHLNVQQATD
ncbi:MAG: FHA domain-containing protein, partial [Steroidobacteraceae bacterium]